MQPRFKTERVRNRKHLDWLKTLPCVWCRAKPCDPAHLPDTATAAMGSKAPDNLTVPLCRGCHTEEHSIGPRKFWSVFLPQAKVLASKLYDNTGNYDLAISFINGWRGK